MLETLFQNPKMDLVPSSDLFKDASISAYPPINLLDSPSSSHSCTGVSNGRAGGADLINQDLAAPPQAASGLFIALAIQIPKVTAMPPPPPNIFLVSV